MVVVVGVVVLGKVVATGVVVAVVVVGGVVVVEVVVVGKVVATVVGVLEGVVEVIVVVGMGVVVAVVLTIAVVVNESQFPREYWCCPRNSKLRVHFLPCGLSHLRPKLTRKDDLLSNEVFTKRSKGLMPCSNTHPESASVRGSQVTLLLLM